MNGRCQPDWPTFFEFKHKELVDSQRSERAALEQKQKERWETETNERAKRLTSGLKGIIVDTSQSHNVS